MAAYGNMWNGSKLNFGSLNLLNSLSLSRSLLYSLPRHCCHCPTWHRHGRCTAKSEASWVNGHNWAPSTLQCNNQNGTPKWVWLIATLKRSWLRTLIVIESYHRNWVPGMTYSGFSLLMELSEGSPFRSFMRLEKSWRVKWIAGLS